MISRAKRCTAVERCRAIQMGAAWCSTNTHKSTNSYKFGQIRTNHSLSVGLLHGSQSLVQAACPFRLGGLGRFRFCRLAIFGKEGFTVVIRRTKNVSPEVLSNLANQRSLQNLSPAHLVHWIWSNQQKHTL